MKRRVDGTSKSSGTAFAQAEDDSTFRDEATSQVIFHYSFQTLHDYFNQKNAIRKENRVTGNKWLTTPPLEMEIDGVVQTVVACVRDSREGKQENAPIHFFVDHPEGILLGHLENSLSELNVDGSWKIDAIGNGTENEFDFSKVSASELNKLIDSLYITLEGTNPKKVEKESAPHVDQPVINVEHRETSSLHLANSRQKIISVLFATSAGLLGISALGFMAQANQSTETKSTEQGFYETDHALYGDATIDVDPETWSDVATVDQTKIDELKAADEIRGLEAKKLNSENQTAGDFSENDVEDPTKVVGKVYRMPIPKQGECLIVNTFNIPNGTVQMVKSANAPALLVNLTKQENIEVGKSHDFTPKFTQDDDADDKFVANLAKASVCNINDPNNIQLDGPQGDLFLKFTSDIASDAPFLQGQ